MTPPKKIFIIIISVQTSKGVYRHITSLHGYISFYEDSPKQIAYKDFSKKWRFYEDSL